MFKIDITTLRVLLFKLFFKKFVFVYNNMVRFYKQENADELFMKS